MFEGLIEAVTPGAWPGVGLSSDPDGSGHGTSSRRGCAPRLYIVVILAILAWGIVFGLAWVIFQLLT